MEGFFTIGWICVPLSTTSMFVPLSFETVTPGVTTVISLHAVELPEPPPHPAKESTGFTTGSSNDSVSVPRGEQIELDGHDAFPVVSLRPGSVTKPVATKSPASPPRWLSDSVTSLMHR